MPLVTRVLHVLPGLAFFQTKDPLAPKSPAFLLSRLPAHPSKLESGAML